MSGLDMATGSCGYFRWPWGDTEYGESGARLYDVLAN